MTATQQLKTRYSPGKYNNSQEDGSKWIYSIKKQG